MKPYGSIQPIANRAASRPVRPLIIAAAAIKVARKVNAVDKGVRVPISIYEHSV